MNPVKPTATLPPLGPNAWMRWEVVSRLLPPGRLDVLEVGCGQGGFAARLAQHHRYVGLEPDPDSYEVAAARLALAGGVGEVRNGDLSLVRTDESFDVLVAFEVIEHIEDDAAALKEWVGHLRPGGWLLLSTPAWQRRFGPADEMVGHYRRYDPPVLRTRLEEAGLVDVDVVHFGAPLGYLLEAGRNYAGRRQLAAAPETSQAERTAASGRTMQPSAWKGTMWRVGSLPFRKIQRVFPSVGPGLIARGRKPTA